MALVASLLIFVNFDPIIGIKSGYGFIGLLIALIIYCFTGNTIAPKSSPTGFKSFGRSLRLSVHFIALFSVLIVAGIGLFSRADASIARTFVLVMILPVGYSLLIIQLYAKPSPKYVLPQILSLFSVDLVTKFLSTDFYFGRGDIPKHVHYTDLIISSGTWRTIPETSFYHFFPGLQTLAGSVSLLTNFSPYSSLVLIGICVYIVVVITVYLLAQMLFDSELIPVCIALGVTMLDPIHRYSVYFYPQSLAVALISIIILVAFKYNSAGPRRYLTGLILSSPIVVALWFTHHLTVVLFVPMVLLLTICPIILNHLYTSGSTVRPQVVPIASLAAGSIIYWLWQDVFYETLISAFFDVISGGKAATDAGAGAKLELLGVQIPETTVSDALISLLSPGGVYNIMLVAALAFSATILLDKSSEYRRAGGPIVVGLFGSILMLRLPIDLHGSARLQLPFSLFVAFVLGIGLYQVLTNSKIKRALPAIVVFVLLSTAGAAVAADDLYALQSGPDLWERQTTPDPQKDFSHAEMQSFRLSSGFIQRNDASVSTDWHTSIGLMRYGTESESFVIENSSIRSDEELLMYRQRWVDHSIRLIPERRSLVTLVVAENWQKDLTTSENKIYTTGEIGMMADRNSTSYFVAR
ncbi:hypothetical protein ACODNH_18810 [Haloarcula sp. NS06]|uniref:hypothetical protein n=1 Tax=Haloarcula sp. NS06 TaxID=3409688 RepID=UPI003DA7A55B